MTRAFVLIQTDIKKLPLIIEELRKIHGVTDAHVLAGPYDAVAHVETDGFESLGKLVTGKIQAVDGVTRTLTCPVHL